MPPKKQPAPQGGDAIADAIPTWTPEQLLAVKHLGPGIIGAEMHAAAQQYVTTTHSGKFGPALL